MGKIDDGGPAFPGAPALPMGDGDRTGEAGMSFRDWIAGQAIAGFMAQSHAGPKDWTAMGHGWGEDCANDLNKNSASVARCLADFAYKMADAVIAARKGGA